MSAPPIIDSQALAIDPEAEIQRICSWMPAAVSRSLGRRGVIIAMSGGVDSSVCAALAVRALGPERVFGLVLPERDSSDDSSELGVALARRLGIRVEIQNISSTLAALGCYQQRDDAIRHLFPDFADDWKCKLAIAGGQRGGINFFKLIVQSPEGRINECRLPLREYLQIVAATNYKQRIRKTIEYFHADRLNYAVIGTPNRLEYDQGFFVKNGDGSADLKPIAHLYKTQVYAIARHLQLPDQICARMPSTETYSLEQGQDEFFFGLPYQAMDLALRYHNLGRSAEELGQALAISTGQAEKVLADIDAKRRSTRYLHRAALLVEPVIAVAPDS